MSFVIRPFDKDYSALANLYSEHYAKPSSEENVRDIEESFPKHLFREIWIAEKASAVVAAAVLTQNKIFFHPDQYDFNIWVSKGTQKQGIADTLFRSVMERALSRSPKLLQCTIPERYADGIRFLQKRDFSESARTFPSEFPLVNFQKEKYAELLNSLYQRGISIQKLSELTDAKFREKIYELFVLLDRKIPGAEIRPLRTFPEFWAKIDDGSQSKESFFVAIDNEKYIGLHFGGPMPGSDEFLVKLTGVLPEYRKQGVGTILKAKGMAYAKENGFSVATTWNDSRNQPILALNEQFGFVRKPAAISFIRHF